MCHIAGEKPKVGKWQELKVCPQQFNAGAEQTVSSNQTDSNAQD
jgi:hypothetical protein